MRNTSKNGVLVVVLSAGIVAGAFAQDFDLRRFTIDGGGVMSSSAGDFELSGTIGQPDSGVLRGGDFVITGGFWFEQVPADCNVDGGVDLHDYTTFKACMSGPRGGLLQQSCVCFDLDADGDVDIGDVGEFQRSFGT
ncbi:MAG: hypothetical protein ACYTFA_04765 [Planctomycetota bacterium]|jgi:hypothetical protein